MLPVPLTLISPHWAGVKRETPKCGLLKCREEPPKLLGNKFQERYFVIRDRRLLLLKEKRVQRGCCAEGPASQGQEERQGGGAWGQWWHGGGCPPGREAGTKLG